MGLRNLFGGNGFTTQISKVWAGNWVASFWMDFLEPSLGRKGRICVVFHKHFLRGTRECFPYSGKVFSKHWLGLGEFKGGPQWPGFVFFGGKISLNPVF